MSGAIFLIVTLGALINELRYERNYLFIHRDTSPGRMGFRRFARLLTRQGHEALERSRQRAVTWWVVWLILCMTVAGIAWLSVWIFLSGESR